MRMCYHLLQLYKFPNFYLYKPQSLIKLRSSIQISPVFRFNLLSDQISSVGETQLLINNNIMSHINIPPLLKSNVHDHHHHHHHHQHHPFAMDIWDPFSDKHREHHPLITRPHNNVMPLMHNPMMSTPLSKRLPARAEWKETPEAHLLTTEIPAGMNREDVKVRVEDNKVLKISGQKHREKEEKHDNWQQFERSEGRFFQAVSLPENSWADHVKYTLEHGILTVTVPKREAKKPHANTTIRIQD